MMAEKTRIFLLLRILVVCASLQLGIAQALKVPAVDTEHSKITPRSTPQTTASSRALETWHCSFARDLCGLTVVETDKATWVRNNTVDTVPTGQDEWCLTMLVDSGDEQRASLETPTFRPFTTHPRCLSFFYYIIGANVSELSVLLRRGEDLGVVVWTQERPQEQQWVAAHLDILFNTPVSIVFEGKKGSNSEAALALDEITLHDSSCHILQPTSAPNQRGTCTFKRGTCGWQNLRLAQNTTNHINWKLGSGDDSINGDAPHADHNEDSSGKFLYVDGYDGANGTATLISQLLVHEHHSDFCFSFWYIIQGGPNDEVSISAVVSDGNSETLLWREGPNPNGGWRKGQVRVNASQFILDVVAYQLHIRGTRTSSNSKIALDDITFGRQYKCKRKPDASVSMVTTAVPSLWNCDFSEDLCGLQLTGYSAEWTRTYLGNSTNHNNDLYSLTVDGLAGEIASARMPQMSAQNGPCCLTFWYMIESFNLGRISVVLILKNASEEAVWTRSQAQGYIWIPAAINVPVDGSTKVTFVGEITDNLQLGTVGIDDLLLLTESCDMILPTVEPDKNWCDFEDRSICGFNRQGGLGDWERVFPRQDNGSVPVDHTYNTGYGHYMRASLTPSDHEGVVARLMTSDIPTTQDTNLCVSFWYVHNGATNRDRLKVYANVSGELGRPLWQEKASNINTWLSASVPIPGGIAGAVQVVWEAWQGERDDHATMALDDVMISTDPCDMIGTCNFTSGTCGWQNVAPGENRTDSVDWLIGSGDHSQDLDGPFQDHSGDPQGMYLYVDSDFRGIGLALLESQIFIPEQHNDLCFHFWHYVEGTADDVVWIEVQTDGHEQRRVWRETGWSEGEWREGQVRVRVQDFFRPTSYQILIGGMKAWPFSVLAVDDFSFVKYSNDCPRLPPPGTTSSPTPTTTTSDKGTVSCDFTEGVCGWQDVAANGIHWTYNSTEHLVWLDLQSLEWEGYYVGQFRSPSFSTAANSTYCLTINWFKEGESEAHFTVMLQNEEGLDVDILMNIDDGSNGQWRSTNLDITKKMTFRVAIKGTVTNSWDGVMAFNNVLLVENPCSEGAVDGRLWCDFETPEECGFRTSLPGDTTVWTWGSGVPSTDHTLHSTYGHTMYVDVSTVGKKKLAHLSTPSITPEDQTFCATFWFYMFGDDVATLTVYSVQDDKPSSPLWRQHQSFHSEWRGGSVSHTVNLEANYTVVFEVLTGGSNWGSLAIDDVKVVPGSCPGLVSCTFDDDLCLWTQNQDDEINWEVVGTLGELHDHTNGSGHFLALRTGNTDLYEALAILDSPPFEVQEVSCFSFWYNMGGSNAVTLQINHEDFDGNQLTLWQLSGPQTSTSQWKYGRMPVYPTDTSSLIIIEGFTVNDDKTKNGTIAVDGTELRLAESCTFEPSEADVGTPMPTTTTSLPTQTPGYNFFCDFENRDDPFCGWQDITPNDEFKWLIVKGALGIEGIGPVSDHTTGLGHYASVSRSPDSIDITKFSTLQSPDMKNQPVKCFVFWYFLRGVKSQLTVRVNTSDSWTRSGSQGNKWRSAKVDMNVGASSWVIILEASLMPDHEYTFVTLDDLLYYNITCDNVDVDMRTGRQCDFEELDLCGWRQVDEDDSANWDWVNGTQGGVASDHSYGTPVGHYLQLTSTKQGPGAQKMALLQLPPYIDMAAGDYCFQMYYMRYGGVHTGNISVLVEFAGEANSLLDLNDKDGALTWTLVQQTYTNMVDQATFGLVVRGEVGSASPSTGSCLVAVDDYSLTSTACPQPGSCTFEDAHTCMWRVETYQDLSWELTDGLESHGHGPSLDHTTNTSTGGYMVVEDFGEQSGMVTKLVSSRMATDVNGHCFSFFFSVSGDNGSQLNVLTRTDNEKNLLWSLTGDQGPQWLFGQVGITGSSNDEEFEIVVEGVTGSYADGWIALDDLFTLPGGCSLLPPDAIPPTTITPSGDIFRCDFEVDLCSMTQATSDDFDWQHQHVVDDSELPSGGYLLVNATGRFPDDRSTVTTPELSQLGLQCVNFKYRLIGSECGFLLLYYTASGSQSETMWQRLTTTIPTWISAHVEVDAGASYSLEWEVQVEGEDCLTLLDNIEITSDGCPVQEQTCDFEYDYDRYCGGYQSGVPTDFQFYRMYSAQSVHKFATEDHTYKSSFGHFSVADLSKASSGEDLATMDGPNILYNSNCLTFWYQFETVDSTTFRVLTSDTNEEIFRVEVGTGMDWQLGAGEVADFGSSGHVIFQIFSGGTPYGYIAIDDIKLDDSQSCPIQGNCDFESDTCGWTNTGNLEWIFSELNDEVDRPLTSTHLKFVTPTDNLVGKTATLTSPVLLHYTTCVKFWFKKAMDAPASLVALVSTAPGYQGENVRTPVWELPDSSMGHWGQGQFHLPSQSVDSIQIEFVAKRLMGNWSLDHIHGLVYLDDLEVSPSSVCELMPSDAIPSTTTTRPSPPPPTVPPMAASCDFSDQNFCEWRSIPGDVTWSVLSGVAGTHYVGPLADHTTGDGYFMSLTPTSDNSKGVATLSSPELNAAQDVCMRWWYHMDGSDVATLDVILKNFNLDTKLWSRSGFQTSGWQEAFIGISSSTTFIVEIRGTQTDDALANLAVDDILFTPTTCPENSGILGSDTVTCTMEQEGDCGIHDDSGKGWVRVQAATADHTTATDQGYVFELRGGITHRTASLKTPSVSSESFGCLTFYYRSEGKEDATLTVSVENENNETVGLKITLLKMAEPAWRAAQTALYTYHGRRLKVVFTGEVGPDAGTVISLDDLTLTQETCPRGTSLQCNFDNDDSCYWTNSNTGLQWFVSDGFSQHRFNGPPSDAAENVFYSIFETGPHHFPGSKARLTSPTLLRSTLDRNLCFFFTFSACCEHAGVLSVLMQDITQTNETIIWQLPISCQHADPLWHEGEVPILDPPENFLLVIQAETWDGQEGFIAFRHPVLEGIDYCNMKPEDAVSRPRPTVPPLTTPAPPIVNAVAECNFENVSHPLCSFQQDVGDNVGTWVQVDASDPPSSSHPVADHTSHNISGHYIAALRQEDDGGREAEVIARLKTPVLQPTLDYCLTFFLHHVGDAPPPVVVHAEARDGPQVVELLRRDYPLQDVWVLVEREVPAGTIDDLFVITIEAEITDRQDGDASIDDLKESIVLISSK
ncbi:MAM and LDL-receptor class A domain-containing protein 1-like [Panulirus ornatus]|uniref:MAM and LDL-receptor class A domain-containing protein 1-like n=1 Tax=Panulirus ornatus TaxID=150431 RepID=UPI003A847A2A